MRWDCVTGEYPPQHGGVSDYLHQVAHVLAATGDEVHVWAPPCVSSSPRDGAVTLHRLPDRFGPRTVTSLGRLAGAARPGRRWLVQYTPRAFGWQAMNVPFCLWLHARGRVDTIWTMFHEVVYPLRRRQPLTHNAMAIVTRVTAALVARASARVFVSIPAWACILRRLAPPSLSIDWLPVPSSVPSSVSPSAVALVRKRLATESDQQLIGHFGTFGGEIGALLAAILPPLLRGDPRRVALLVGRGGDAFAAALKNAEPALEGRLHATGGLAPDAVAAHLAACDVLVQPYPDGVSSRRTSVMAGLALGLPIVTPHGDLTESVWAEDDAVELAPAVVPASLVRTTETLLADADRRQRLRVNALRMYASRFALERVVEKLRHGE